MDKTPILSVIIPHYNSPELLRKAITSACVNSNVQVIVVDDKSDLSKELLVSLEGFCKDKNAFFYRNSTDKKGAGVCRNIGLEHATGDWLLLLDADDYFVDGWYEVVSPFFDSTADMIYFPPLAIRLETGEKDGRSQMYFDMVTEYLRNHSEKNELQLRYRFVNSASKMVRLQIIRENNIRFDEVICSNDVMFMTQCAYYSKQVDACKSPIYVATRSKGTLTSKKTEAKFLIALDVFIRRYQFLKERLEDNKFKAVHLSWVAMAKLIDAFISGLGMKCVIDTYKKFKLNNIRFIDCAMFFPLNIYKNLKIEFLWHIGIAKVKHKR